MDRRDCGTEQPADQCSNQGPCTQSRRNAAAATFLCSRRFMAGWGASAQAKLNHGSTAPDNGDQTDKAMQTSSEFIWDFGSQPAVHAGVCGSVSLISNQKR